MSNDPATLDQLRVLIAIADTGSFSGAGRQLHRVQSAISHAVATMEEQFGTPLFDRASRRPVLTEAGKSVLTLAREVCARADGLRELAASLARGEEAVVELAVDAAYPLCVLTAACSDFARRWPAVELRLHSDILGQVAELVRQGTCVFGIVGPAADHRGLHARYLGDARMLAVVAPSHPLAAFPGPIPSEILAESVQIVLSEHGRDADTPDQGVLSARTWRVHDIYTKRALLIAGSGWGNLPDSIVTEDLETGRLQRIRPMAWPADGLNLPISVVTRPDRPPGPAGRWLLERLAQIGPLQLSL